MSTTIRMNILSKYSVLFLCFLFTGCISADENSFIDTHNQHMFEGVVKENVGLDANDNSETYSYLSLDHPINVEKDEFSAERKGVKNIQIVFLFFDGVKLKDLKNKTVRIRGTLFHRHSAHHHTDVLLEVMNSTDVIVVKQ